jgi:hypothetical protein
MQILQSAGIANKPALYQLIVTRRTATQFSEPIPGGLPSIVANPSDLFVK